ncbi:protein PSK SIMULATOR 1-like [Humulus lupulus]|uniref:protein PSK SIMULATOR 1-like n=1 Tax=Humulus lupulus TaxID=3486 RepID=UPI002B417634|nr:protein PSK SIMULATOR 1-like [Humulus lupulus]
MVGLRFPWKNSAENPEPVIGILGCEVVGLMSKVANLWHCLGDKEIQRLREQIEDSVGVKMLVSEDDNYLFELALEEIIENFGCLSKSVVRLGRRCKDPLYHRLEQFFKDPFQTYFQWFGLAYRWKKMEKKVKKIEKFVAVTMQLSQEQDVLVELEQTLRRMQKNSQLDRVKLLEYQQKVMWQRQEVKNLRGLCPSVRTYDYIVRLLARSLFTILERLKLVFGVIQMASAEGKNNCEPRSSDCLLRTHSFSTHLHSSVHPSETNVCGFSSGPPVGSFAKQVANVGKNRLSDLLQQDPHQSLTQRIKLQNSKSRRHRGSFSGCMIGGVYSPVVENCRPLVGGSMRLSPTYMKTANNTKSKGPLSSSNNVYLKLAMFNSKSKLLNVRASTLGEAALALHYANVIILIEKLVSSPHLISADTRDDLYNMLPTTVRASLRAKIKLFAKTMGSSVYSPALAAEWNMALLQILEWLAPLAHNMIRWHSERNIEKQHEVAKTNVLLVLTLYHANQAKTEAAITELLIGLNYMSRISAVNERAILWSAGKQPCKINRELASS